MRCHHPLLVLDDCRPDCGLAAAVAQWTGTSRIGMAIFWTVSGYVIALSYSHWNWREAPLFNLTRLFFYRFARSIRRSSPSPC